MLRPIQVAVLALATSLLLAASSRADEMLVTLASGDTIRAVIVREADGVLVIRHPVLGELSVPRTQVVSIAPAPPVDATARQSAEAATPAPEATAATPVAPATPAAAAPAKDAAPPVPAGAPAEPAAQDPEAAKWTASIEGTVNMVAAETNQVDLRVAAKILRESKDDKLNMWAEYFLRTLADDLSNIGSNITDSNLLANVTYDSFFNPTPWLWFAKGQYEYDINQNWENRVGGWAGLGYRFFMENDKLSLTPKLGFGVTREFGGVDEWYPQMYGEIEGSWTIDERQKLTGSAFITPDLSDFSVYTILARLEWSMKLDVRSGLSLVGGIRDQFQSKDLNGAKKNDFRLYLGFKLDI
jgi:hypothetical protein